MADNSTMMVEDGAPPSADVDEMPQIPHYLASPNAVFGDEGVKWRYGRPPDYTKTRKVWAEGKMMSHAPGSLEEMVENLVKNWEVEASFKPRLSDWRTIDHDNYSFAMAGGPPQTAEHMIKVGTYNGIIAPNEFYSPENSDFASSHKTFKRMMPTFAWEVLEVYSGPPRVAFRWRHWGVMKNDYVGFNNKGEKVTAKAHGGLIDIEGVTVAEVHDKVRMRAIQTWMDPLEMFRQIAPHGIVKKETMNRTVDMETALDMGSNDEVQGVTAASENHDYEHYHDAESHVPSDVVTEVEASHVEGVESKDMPNVASTSTDESITSVADEKSPAQATVEAASPQGSDVAIDKPESNAKEITEPIKPIEEQCDATASDVPQSEYSSIVTGDLESLIVAAKRDNVGEESKASGPYDAVDKHLGGSTEVVHPHPKDKQQEMAPDPREAVVAAPDSEEARMTHEEMSKMSADECPFLMSRE